MLGTLVIVGAAALLLAGCTSQSSGSPIAAGGSTNETSSSRSSPAGSSTNSNGSAPPITQPELDVKKFEDAACGLLKPEQLNTLGASKAGTTSQGASGPQCSWKSDDVVKGTNFSVIIMKNSNGLDGLYGNKSDYPVSGQAKSPATLQSTQISQTPLMARALRQWEPQRGKHSPFHPR
jgi:hypothetical protein